MPKVKMFFEVEINPANDDYLEVTLLRGPQKLAVQVIRKGDPPLSGIIETALYQDLNMLSFEAMGVSKNG